MFTPRVAIILSFILSFPHLVLGQDPHAIKSIYFGGGSFYIDDIQTKELADFISKNIQSGQYHITVHSYTDDIGGVEYNAWLSEMRSDAVIQKLIDSSIKREFIQVKDFGQYNPVYDNSTWEGRLKNRRADVILWPVVF